MRTRQRTSRSTPPLLTAIASLAAFAPATAGQSSVAVPTPTAFGPAGDVNGDGLADHVVQNGGTLDVIDAATNTPIPWLQRPAVGGAGFSFRYTPIGDHDGDGKDDLFHWIPSAAAFGVYTVVSGANGTALFTVNGPVVGAGGADFDGDGRSDLLLVANGTARVLSARTGATLFEVTSPPQTLTSPFMNGIASAGDEDGDGRDDVIVQHIVLASGNAQFSTLVRSPGTSQSIANPRAVGDVTGDGKADFQSSASGSSNSVIVAGGSQATVWLLPPNDVVARVGDVDGDGNHDLAIGTLNGSGYSFVLASGATHGPLPGAAPTAVPNVLGDIDGDGRSETSDNAHLYEWQDPNLPIASRLLRRGTPGTTSDGRRPYVVTRGHCGLGRTVFFDLRGCMPNGLALLVYGSNVDVDLTGLGAPNNRSYTSLAGGLAFVANGNGIAQYQATMPLSPSLLGASLSLQSVVVDAAANALGLVTSNAIDVTTNN